MINKMKQPQQRLSAENEAGFSIMELVVAIFFIAVILTAVAANMSRAARALWESKTRFYAVNMAQNCIEDFNYSNRKFTWRAFFDNDGMAELCRLPVPSNQRMTYLCCGDCNQIPGLEGNNPACEAVVIDNLGNDEVLGGVSELTHAWRAERVFYDVDTDTIFNFIIRKAGGEITFDRHVVDIDGAGNRVLRVEEDSREIVVVNIEVTWERFQSFRPGDGNHFSLTRQFLAPL